ncbi:hypothetical protein SMCF_7349 [Streptomyces coelicoflavus ZG0656]|nr:hypothetical protein SMCF_7349 [Streptomyces coelicoflavus ZG0656]MZE49208.1 hypothetical protein [Streptomyces sp. SID5477]
MRDAAAVLRPRPRLPPEAAGRLEDALVPDWLLARVGDAVFFAVDFLAAAVFFAVDFCAVDFCAAAVFADLAVAGLAAVDLAAVFLAPAPVVLFAAAVLVAAAPAVVFLAVVFLAVVFLAVVFLAVVFLAGVRADLAPDSEPEAPRVPVPSAPFAALPSPFRPLRAACPLRPRDCVNQATAAPVAATGHSTSPATPSTPAPV